MIEATIIFKDGIQTYLTLNVSFEVKRKEIEINSKVGVINNLDERIPSYMHILGRFLKKRVESFWNEKELRLWIPEQ